MPEQNDHDLLIRLDTKFDLLTDKVNEMSSNLIKRVDALEQASIRNDEEHKRFVPIKYLYICIGAYSIIQFAIGYYLIVHYGNNPL